MNNIPTKPEGETKTRFIRSAIGYELLKFEPVSVEITDTNEGFSFIIGGYDEKGIDEYADFLLTKLNA